MQKELEDILNKLSPEEQTTLLDGLKNEISEKVSDSLYELRGAISQLQDENSEIINKYNYVASSEFNYEGDSGFESSVDIDYIDDRIGAALNKIDDTFRRSDIETDTSDEVTTDNYQDNDESRMVSLIEIYKEQYSNLCERNELLKQSNSNKENIIETAAELMNISKGEAASILNIPDNSIILPLVDDGRYKDLDEKLKGFDEFSVRNDLNLYMTTYSETYFDEVCEEYDIPQALQERILNSDSYSNVCKDISKYLKDGDVSHVYDKIAFETSWEPGKNNSPEAVSITINDGWNKFDIVFELDDFIGAEDKTYVSKQLIYINNSEEPTVEIEYNTDQLYDVSPMVVFEDLKSLPYIVELKDIIEPHLGYMEDHISSKFVDDEIIRNSDGDIIYSYSRIEDTSSIEYLRGSNDNGDKQCTFDIKFYDGANKECVGEFYINYDFDSENQKDNFSTAHYVVHDGDSQKNIKLDSDKILSNDLKYLLIDFGDYGILYDTEKEICDKIAENLSDYFGEDFDAYKINDFDDDFKEENKVIDDDSENSIDDLGSDF